MKVQTFVAYAFAASAAAASAAWATMPSGPQGTGAYGAPNGAVPLPQSVPPGYVYPGPYLAPTADPVRDSSATRDVIADRNALDRDPPANDATGRSARRWVHQGPSWATNPPAPAP